MEDFSMDELMVTGNMDEISQEMNKRDREIEEQIKKLKAERAELDKQIKMLKNPKSRLHSKVRFTKDEIKGKWYIAIVGSYYTRKREKGEPWYEIEKRPFTEKMERWIPIIQGITEEEVKKELKETIKALQTLDKEINQ